MWSNAGWRSDFGGWYKNKVAANSTTTLDPATNTSGHQTLSNGNLTTTGDGTTGTVRSVAGYSTGKYYFEATVTTGVQAIIGVCISAQSVTLYPGANGNGIGIYNSGGWLGPAAGSITTAPATITGHTYGFAFDATARKVWVKDITAAGNWNANATADPATGVNGTTLSSPMDTGNLYAAADADSNGDSVTYNFGATAYVGTAPSGFGNM